MWKPGYPKHGGKIRAVSERQKVTQESWFRSLTAPKPTRLLRLLMVAPRRKPLHLSCGYTW
jgi:hypothetical protein